MFKTNQESLDEFSFLQNHELSTLVNTITNAQRRKLLSCSDDEAKRVLEGLEQVAQLKLNGKVYAFHIEDEYSLGCGGHYSGVQLHLRQGDLLREFCIYDGRETCYK